MSWHELAEAVNACLYAMTGCGSIWDARYIARLERGETRWPGAAYRRALRAVLGAATDAELGFYVVRRADDTAADQAFKLADADLRARFQQLLIRPDDEAPAAGKASPCDACAYSILREAGSR
jgi:transcriptional regulator with XRE-family HTH domain